MRTLILVAFVVALSCLPASARGAPIAYAVDTNSNLYSIDLANANATLIGNTGAGFIEGLALSPSGQLYGTTDSGSFHQLNTLTGAATLIGSTGLGNIEGLDFNGNTLLASNFDTTPSIYSIDVTSGAPTLVVTATSETDNVRAMTTLDGNTMLIRTDLPGPNTLREIDLTTGATTILGNLGGGLFAAIDFADDGFLYGLDTDGSLYRIDPANAATTLIGNTGNQFWLAMAAAPQPLQSEVPEPISVALWGVMGMAGLGYRAWQHRRNGLR